MSSRILLVEDEPGLVVTISDLLGAEGYEVEAASDGEAALEKAASGSFELVLLDVMLPKKNGYDVCRELRQRGIDSAILMLTARTQVVDRVVGLKLGADDYLAKPFDPAELLARIEALLRRVGKNHRVPVQTFQFGEVEVDFERAQVRKHGEPVTLASKELQLLRYLVDRRGRCGNTAPRFPRVRWTSISPGCAKNWKTTRRIPATSKPFAAAATGSPPER